MSEQPKPTSVAHAPSHQLSSLDHFYLEVEEMGWEMSVSSVMWLEGDVAPETAIAAFSQLTTLFPKFRQRYEVGGFMQRARWVDANEPSTKSNAKRREHPWSVGEHLDVAEISLADDKTAIPPESLDEYERRELENIASRFLSGHLDPSAPLWRAMLVRGLHSADGKPRGRTAMVFRAHHSMADGTGFAIALTALLKPNTPDQPKALDNNAFRPAKSAKKVQTLPKQTPKSVAQAFYSMQLLFSALLLLLISIVNTIWSIARGAVARRRAFIHDHPQSGHRRVAWSNPVAMEDIALVRRAHPGVTLNDVMIACVQQAFAGYTVTESVSKKDGTKKTQVSFPATKDRHLNLYIPFSMRSAGDNSFDNQASLDLGIFPMLPDGSNSDKLLQETHKRMMTMKQSFVPAINKAFLSKLYTPGVLRISPMGSYFEKAHGVLTNVPGPTETLWFGNRDSNSESDESSHMHRVLGYTIYPPSLGKGSVGMGICSYNGKVWLSALGEDMEAYTDQTRILVDNFNRAFDRILSEAHRKLENSTSDDGKLKSE